MDKNNIKYILEKDMDRFDQYIERADNKANFILTISGAILIAIIFQNKDLFYDIDNNIIKNIIFLDSALVAISLICSIYFSLLVIIPRTSVGTYTSVFYFEDVKYLRNSEFYEKLKNISEDEFIEDFSKQVNQLSIIVSKKMSRVKSAYKCLNFSVVGIVILVIINFIK